MRNVDMNSAVIRRLFRARPQSSLQPVLTDSERRAAASAADNEDAIGTASPDEQLPLHFDLQDWNRSRRLGFDWDDLYYLADYRADVNYAVLTGVSAAKSALVRMYQGQYQVPVSFAVDRTFIESGVVAWFISFLELWLVEGLDEWELVEDAVMTSQLGTYFTYGDDADSARLAARRLDGERVRILSDMETLRRDLDDARGVVDRRRLTDAQMVDLRAENARLRSRLEEGERENHSLLRELRSCHRRRSLSPSHSLSPKRRRRSDGGWRSGPHW